MFKRMITLLLAVMMTISITACGSKEKSKETSGAEEKAEESVVAEAEAPEESAATEDETAEESTETEDETSEEPADEETVAETDYVLGTVANDLAEDEDALIATYAGAFTQESFTDSDTGLSITYNLYLPEDYDESKKYPMVVFIADSSCAGGDATRSLSQGRGALVWASDEWQSVNPTIVAVPTYPETILDDHGAYTTTEYVELTKRYIDYMSENYSVDTNRIYGTGQSMGCMTTLILASEYPDLYAACMFVDGQWDVSELQGLENQTFVYFAAEDDERAYAGMQEVMAMFDADSTSYKYEQWDGYSSVNDLSDSAFSLFDENEDQYFISWTTGTIEASGGMGGAAYHMASFDYAYNCVAVMEWLFQQSK